MKKKLSLIILIISAFTVSAQEVLTLERCRELALENNKQMAVAAKQTQVAYYTMKSYRGNFFPNFIANATGLYSSANGTFNIPGGNLPTFLPDVNGQLIPNGGFAYFPGIDLNYKVRTVWMGGLQVEQPIFMGGKILASYKMANLGKQVAQLNETLTASEVILETNHAYALMVKAQEMNKVAQSYNAVLQELMKNVQSAYKYGLKSKNDVLKVQVKLNECELSIRKAENALSLANMNLCHLIGRPLNETLIISDDFPVIEQHLEMQVNDISARPEYNLLDKQVDIAKQQVKLSRSELLPQVGIRGSYDYMHGLKINEQNLFDKGSFSVMLNVSVPLFHFGERINKVRAAKAQLEQVRMEQADLNEKMYLELTQAANNLEEAKLQAALADRSLNQADENRSISKKEYDAGLEPLSDHLEAQALWQQAYETKVDAHFQLYLNYVKYLKAAGKLQ
ncbi:MAG: TolC family protein [Mediterranea massiliensis]|nr:TolC family protein [Mediterranea massiliensis]